MANDGGKPLVRLKNSIKHKRTGQVDFIALSRDLVHAVQTGVYVVQSGKFVYVNPFFERLTGYSSDELTGKKSLSLVFPKDRPSVRKKAIRNLKSRHNSKPYEYRFIKKNGDLLWVLERVTSIEYMGRMATLGSFMEIGQHKELEEALAHSEERYRTILEQMYDSYYEVDLSGNFTFVNDATAQNLGYTKEEMVGKNYRMVVPEEDIKKLFLTFNHVYTSGIPNRGFVHGIYRKDGSTIVVESSVDLRRNERDEPIGFRSIVRDVTERTKLEEELQKLAAVVWHSNELINIATMDGKMTYLNETGSRILGIDPEEVENFIILQVIPEHLKDIVSNELLPTLTKEGVWEGELQYINLKTGQLTDVYANTFTVKDTRTDEPLFMANVSRDITSRKKAEAAARESEERYRALFDRSLDLVYVRDFKGNFIDANLAALNLMGYCTEDIKKLNITDLLTPDQYAKTLQTLKELSETGTQKEQVEYMLKRRDGNYVYVETKESVVYREGKPYAVQGIGRDITERKLADERSVIRRDLAIALNKLIPLEKALALCLDAAIRISRMDSGAIYFVDEKAGGIRLIDYRGFSAELAAKYSMFGADSVNARIIMKGQPLYLHYEDLTQPFSEQLSALELEVFAIVPIKRDERVVACLLVSSHSLKDVLVSARNSLETIAAEIGTAIERITFREALQKSEQSYRLIADNTTDVIWAMDRKLRYTFISPSVLRQRGITVEEALALNITSVITPVSIDPVLKKIEEETAVELSGPATGVHTFTQELEMYRKDGTTFWAETSITVLKTPDGRFEGLLGVTRDITVRKLLEQKLEEMATHDYLTGLPNRVLLQDRFTVAAALAHRNNYRLAIMSLDLDQFKPVNDTYGHNYGDLVLKAVGKRLSGIIRASDTIARMGGDEFLLMLLETNHTDDVTSIAHKILDSFNEPFSVDEHQFQLTVSAGIAIYPEDGQDLETLLKKSDDAMYAAKKSGGNRFIFYNDLNEN